MRPIDRLREARRSVKARAESRNVTVILCVRICVELDLKLISVVMFFVIFERGWGLVGGSDRLISLQALAGSDSPMHTDSHVSKLSKFFENL